MSQHEVEYLERRALEERQRAEGANCVASARSHKDLSKAYRASADRLRRADAAAANAPDVTERRGA